VAIGSLKLEGRGPFYLRSVEHAIASELDSTIQLRLYARIEGEEERLFQIETQMTAHTAKELVSMLVRALHEIAL
jgi:hypothetical protein